MKSHCQDLLRIDVQRMDASGSHCLFQHHFTWEKTTVLKSVGEFEQMRRGIKSEETAPALWTRTCPRPSAPSEGGSWWTVARSPGLSVFPAPGTGWSVAHSCLRPTLDRNSPEKFLFRESWRDLPLAALRILATRRAAVGRSSVRYNYRLWAPASSGRIPLLKVPTNKLPGLRLTTETT